MSNNLREPPAELGHHSAKYTTEETNVVSSMAEILAVLYRSVLRADPTRPDWPGRDWFICTRKEDCGMWSKLPRPSTTVGARPYAHRLCRRLC